MSKHLDDLKKVIEKYERIETIVQEHGIVGEEYLDNMHSFHAPERGNVGFTWGLLFPHPDICNEKFFVKAECALYFGNPSDQIEERFCSQTTLLVKFRYFGDEGWVWRVKFTAERWWRDRDKPNQATNEVRELLRACHLEPHYSSRTVSEDEAFEIIAMFASYYAKLPANEGATTTE